MSIRFRCDQCGQKLRVGDDKAGQQAKCPKCKSSVKVPEESQAIVEPSSGAEETAPPSMGTAPTGNPTAKEAPEVAEATHRPLPSIAVSRDSARNQSLPEIVIRDDSVDWAYASDSQPTRSESIVDYDKIAVPRRVLYLQGGLLAVVALVSFILGMLTSDRSSPRDSTGPVAQSCVLSGQITYGGDPARPDAGGVVIVLPADRRPAAGGRVATEGLRPGDPVPVDGNISLRTIRGMGGDYGRTNDEGRYQIRLPEFGRYHVLVISHRAARSANDRVEASDVAQIGRYFASAVDLLDDRRYQWRTLNLHGNTTLDASF